MDLAHRREMMHVLDAKLEARDFDGRAVLLFGHCNATEEMADYLLAKGIMPAAILDNNTSKQGLAYRDVPIVTPARIHSYNSENSIVLIATRYYAAMSAQLSLLGYFGNIIQVVGYNSFSDYSLSGETVIRKKARMLRGAATLARIREEYPTRHMVVCPNSALGDVYWACAFLPTYLDKHGIGETFVVTVGNGCSQVADMFGIDNVSLPDQASMDELVQALIFSCEGNCIIAHHDRPYTDKIITYLDKHFLSFIDYYRCAVYGLPKGTEALVPSKLRPLLRTSCIAKGKSVILAPYAKSITQPPVSFWEMLALEWGGMGYNVFTCLSAGEQPIAGTVPLSLPLDQMVSAAEYAGVFIGLRSGLCDIVHTAQCRKIAVFPDCCYSTTPHKVRDFFELPGWETVIA